MNELATQQRAVDPWGYYAETVKTGTSDVFLSYKKGKYVYGQDKDELPLGTVLIFNMSTMEAGHQRWEAGKPAGKSFVYVEVGLAPPPREQLGWTEEQDWEDDMSSGKIEYVPETDKNGNEIRDEKGKISVKVKKKDPWQAQTKIKCVGEDGVQYEFSTGSKGGVGALGSLCAAYGPASREHPNDHPKVKIGTDTYHNKHTKSDVHFPTFKIVGWINKDESVDTSAVASSIEAPASVGEVEAF